MYMYHYYSSRNLYMPTTPFNTFLTQRIPLRDYLVKCIGYTKSGQANTVCNCNSGCEGYTRKAILLLPTVIQLTSLVL